MGEQREESRSGLNRLVEYREETSFQLAHQVFDGIVKARQILERRARVNRSAADHRRHHFRGEHLAALREHLAGDPVKKRLGVKHEAVHVEHNGGNP